MVRYFAEETYNDAQACYDQIIPVVVSYALLRLGLPPHLVRFQCKWLEHTKYCLKLQNQLSKCYQSTPTNYLHGTGQGTGWFPPSWASLSDIISRIMERETAGMRLVHPNNTYIERVLEAFVDDVNRRLTEAAYKAFKPSPSALVPKRPTLYDQTESNVQFYSRLLFTTGGKLALHKCAIYILFITWINGYRKYKETQDEYPSISIQQGINLDYQQIPLEPSKIARKMLGVYLAPDSSSDMQLNVLHAKSKKWQLSLQNNTLY